MVIAATNRSLSEREEALSILFASTARVSVLRVFLLDPARPYYQRQIELAAGLPIRAVQREVQRLSAIGLLFRREEGNRAYYQVDTSFPLFPELREMMLKSVDALSALRGRLAADANVRLALASADGTRVLAVGQPGRRPLAPSAPSIAIETMTSESFSEALSARREHITEYLSEGTDLLGRRDDAIWGHIASAGFAVRKGVGVP